MKKIMLIQMLVLTICFSNNALSADYVKCIIVETQLVLRTIYLSRHNDIIFDTIVSKKGHKIVPEYDKNTNNLKINFNDSPIMDLDLSRIFKNQMNRLESYFYPLEDNHSLFSVECKDITISEIIIKMANELSSKELYPFQKECKSEASK